MKHYLNVSINKTPAAVQTAAQEQPAEMSSKQLQKLLFLLPHTITVLQLFFRDHPGETVSEEKF